MIEKYRHIFESIHSYIFNRIQIIDSDLDIAREIYAKFPAYVAFFKVDTEMQVEMLEQIVAGARLARRMLHTEEVDNGNV